MIFEDSLGYFFWFPSFLRFVMDTKYSASICLMVCAPGMQTHKGLKERVACLFLDKEPPAATSSCPSSSEFGIRVVTVCALWCPSIYVAFRLGWHVLCQSHVHNKRILVPNFHLGPGMRFQGFHHTVDIQGLLRKAYVPDCWHFVACWLCQPLHPNLPSWLSFGQISFIFQAIVFSEVQWSCPARSQGSDHLGTPPGESPGG